jgi:hypothetical protein
MCFEDGRVQPLSVDWMNGGLWLRCLFSRMFRDDVVTNVGLSAGGRAVGTAIVVDHWEALIRGESRFHDVFEFRDNSDVIFFGNGCKNFAVGGRNLQSMLGGQVGDDVAFTSPTVALLADLADKKRYMGVDNHVV